MAPARPPVISSVSTSSLYRGLNHSDPFGLCPIEKDGIPCTLTMAAAGGLTGAVVGAAIGGGVGTAALPGGGTVVLGAGGAASGASLGVMYGGLIGLGRDLLSLGKMVLNSNANPSSEEIVDAVEGAGATVTPHPTRTGEGTLIKWPDGSVTDIRVENHPIPGSKGQPVRHGNVDHWDPNGNKVTGKHILP